MQNGTSITQRFGMVRRDRERLVIAIKRLDEAVEAVERDGSASPTFRIFRLERHGAVETRQGLLVSAEPSMHQRELPMRARLTRRDRQYPR